MNSNEMRPRWVGRIRDPTSKAWKDVREGVPAVHEALNKVVQKVADTPKKSVEKVAATVSN